MAKLEFAVYEDGLLNFFDDVPEAVDRYETLIGEVQLEEEVGFKYHFIIEHQNVHFGQISSPMVYLSALAQRTSTIRFAQLVFATPFYHPMRFAMDTAMIDQLSRGRLEVGVGSGANRYETDRWNIPFSERRERFPEFMEIVKKAWTEECVTYNGKYWQFDNAIALPRPYQKPHPPSGLLVAAGGFWSGVPPITPTTVIFASRTRKLPKASMSIDKYAESSGIPSKPCRSPTFTDPSTLRKPMRRPMRILPPISQRPTSGVTKNTTGCLR